MLVYFAISSSSAFTFGPVVIHPEFREDTTSSITDGSIYGEKRDIHILQFYN